MCVSFTQNGYGLAGRLEEQLQGDCEEICVFTKFSGADPQEPAGEDVKKSKNVEVVTEPIAWWAEEQMQSAERSYLYWGLRNCCFGRLLLP